MTPRTLLLAALAAVTEAPAWAAASLPPPPPASAATAGLVAPGPRFSTSPCADGTLDLAITERPPAAATTRPTASPPGG